MNEVLAYRATMIRQCEAKDADAIHPNTHVNLGQASNDVMPSALHLAALEAIDSMLLPALNALHDALSDKAMSFGEIRKVGRTHLMDAVSLTLGDEFSGYAAQVRHGHRRITAARDALLELPLGGTAVGTGINAHPDFARHIIAALSAASGLPLREAENHFEAQGAREAAVECSAALKTIAVSLLKITGDIRWMASGPRAGLGEIRIPAVQPGSSIMPGKVNPVIPEALAQVCARVIGNDTAITIAGQSGQFELNTMIPLITVSLLEAIELLAHGTRTFAEKCVRGIEVNTDRLRRQVAENIMMVTALVPMIGYDEAAAIAQETERSGRPLREILRERTSLPPEEIERLLS